MSTISLLAGRQAQTPTQCFINNEWVSGHPADLMWGSRKKRPSEQSRAWSAWLTQNEPVTFAG